jgi:hypothetical protein
MLKICPDAAFLGIGTRLVGIGWKTSEAPLGIGGSLGCQKGKTRRHDLGFRSKDGRANGSHGLPATRGGDSIDPWLATHKSFKKVLTAYRFAASC